MPSPSLQELLQRVSVCDDQHNRYDLFEELVAVVKELRSDKRLAALVYVHTELAEAKAEIKRLQENCDHLHTQKAKLRKRLREVTRDGLALVQKVREERDEANTEARRLAPNAKVGWLVRNMKDRTALRRTIHGSFGVADHTDEKGWCSLGLAATDPADVLAHIQQEVNDARGV